MAINSGGVFMNKEEILEKSRFENRNLDEMEKDTLLKAGRLASGVGGMLCMLIMLIEISLSAKGPSLCLWTVYLSMTSTTLLVKYKSRKKKHELIFGLIQMALAVIFLVLHIMKIVR